MKVIETPLPGVLILEPRVFGDARGFFLESFNQRRFDEAVGSHVEFVQDNQSRSARGVLRGLHFQRGANAQGKLVHVTSGAVFDVAVDVTADSPTRGRWTAVELTAENHRQFWIPAGYAHGFLVLSEWADFLYKTTTYYAPSDEGAVRWNDPELAIAWPDVGARPQLSAKDSEAPFLRDLL